MTAPTCPECRVAMTEGYTLDRGHHNAISQANWIEGSPDRRWWGIRLKGKQRIPIVTYRCPRCGTLRSFARAT